MGGIVYTLGVWKVKPGHETLFIEAWKPLELIFSKLTNPPIDLTVIQDMTNSTRFFSFAPWHRLDDVDAMWSDHNAKEAIQHLMVLCTDATPGTFHVVASMSAIP